MSNCTLLSRATAVVVAAVVAAPLSAGDSPSEIVTQLATWDIAPGDPGNVDFDPQLDAQPSVSGGWFQRSQGSGLVYGQSTAPGTFTQGTGSLELNITGLGTGGEYQATINGAPFDLDTHFDVPAGVVYGGGADTRDDALRDAIQSGAQSLYSIRFDLIYDIQQMRSIAWQPPEETVDPEGNGQYPQRFFWTSMWGETSDGGFGFTGFDTYSINPFDEQWDEVPYAVFEAEFSLTDFDFGNFSPDAALNEIRLGILYNSVFGTLPAASNTESARIFIDNLRLVEQDVVSQIDFNMSGTVELADFDIFMSQHLVPAPSLGDFDGDGDNDFNDFTAFEELYSLATGSTLAEALAAVPEPGALMLAGLAASVLALRRRAAALVVVAAASASMLSADQAFAQAGQVGQVTVLESWEDLSNGGWEANANFAGSGNAGAIMPTIEQSATGATDGSSSLKITQFGDNGADPGQFSWNAVTTANWTPGHPAYDALSEAVSIGAEHYVVHVDTFFDSSELPDANLLTIAFGFDFVGIDAGTWELGVTPDGLQTTTIPLSSFNLLDPEDQGNPDISAQVAFSGNELSIDPFSAYIDNVRLEQVSAPDLLTLEVNRGTGNGTLRNDSGVDISLNYLTIKSAAGGLDPAGWSSLDDQNAGDGAWVEAGGSSTSQLAEANLLGNLTLSDGESVPLGVVMNPLVGNADLDFEIRREAGSVRTYDQFVEYVGTQVAVAGDYNADGRVDAADYTAYRDALGQEITLPNETATPGVVTEEDYDVWVSNYGAVAATTSLAIPEPSSLAILLAGVALSTRAVPRRRKHG